MNINKYGKIFLGDTEIYRVEYEGTVIWKKEHVVPPTPTGGTIAYDANGNVIASTNESVIPNNWLADNKNVASVVFADNVTEIKQYAFNACSNLTSVTFNNNLQIIGMGAFISCNLSTVDIPDSVTTLSDWCFDGNHNLTQVNGCNNVEFMGDHAFYDCALTSFTIPTKVTSLNKYALGSNPFTSITIPAQVTSIGDMCFDSCTGLTEIICESETEITDFGTLAPFNNIPLFGKLKTPNSSDDWTTFLAKLRAGWTQQKPLPNYLRFDATTNDVTIGVNNLSLFNNLEYSYNPDSTLNPWWGLDSSYPNIYLSKGSTVYLRGTGMSTSGTKRGFTTSAPVECHGDVRSLLANENFENAAITNYCFYGLFSGSKITTAPELNAMTLAAHCYDSMLQALTNLTTAPELPATTLADYCYEGIFDGSSGLINPPTVLPAENVPSRAYEYMFNGCTNLKTAPEIKAKSIGSAGCRYMFNNCKSLVNAPELEFTTISASGCTSMFGNCSELVTSPSELKPTSIGNNTYQGMFDNCTKLETIPKIKATSVGSRSCRYMFNNCTNLTSVELLASGLGTATYSYMFNGCSSLNHIAVPYFTSWNTSTFEGWVGGVASTGTFVKPSALTSIPTGTSGIPSGWTVINE